MVEEEINNVNKKDIKKDINPDIKADINIKSKDKVDTKTIKENLLTEKDDLESKSLEYKINFIFDYFVKHKRISI